MKKIIYLIVFIFIFISLNTCISQGSHSNLRIGAVQWIGYAPLYIAEHDKSLPKNLRIIDYASNYDILEDIKAGRIDAAFLTFDEIHTLKKDGFKFQIIYAIDTSNGADAILAKKSIKNIKELKNKRVAYEPQTVQEYLLFRALEKNCMKMHDIQSVLCKFDEQSDLIKKDAFDAIVTFEPVKSKLLQNDLHTVFSSRDIPNEIVDLLVVRDRTLQENKNTLQKTIQALMNAVKQIKHDATTDSVVAEYLHTTPQAVRSSYKDIKLLSKEENLQLLSSDSPVLLNITKHIHRYHRFDLKNNNPQDIINTKLLKEAY